MLNGGNRAPPGGAEVSRLFQNLNARSGKGLMVIVE